MLQLKIKTEHPKLCSICGRFSKGYHYDVIACKGCKTFFRRMFLLKIKPKCDLKNDCFDLEIRNEPYIRCRGCRLNKCIKVGMNPLAIQISEDEHIAILAKQGCSDETSQIKTLESMDNKMKNVVEMLTYLEYKLEEFRTSAYNPQWLDFNDLEHLIADPSRMCLADKYGPMPFKKRKESSLPPINQKEKGLPNNSSPKIWSICNMLTAVENIKNFPFFHKLSTKDQFILARYTALICVNLLVSHYAVTQKYEGCLQPDGAQEPENDERHYPMAVMAIPSLIRCQIEPVEFVLLKAICVCNPAVPDLSEDAQTILANERRQLTNILFDHCLRNRKDGPARLAELIGIFHVFENQQRMQRNMYLLFIAPRLSESLKKQIRFLHEIMAP